MMALKILGAGFGRTGTYSLKLALESLGFGPCHHMYEVRDHAHLLADWVHAAQGKPISWDRAFEGYNAQVDWPGSVYWRQLHDHFPTAKVILTTRDPEAWYDSLLATVIPSITIGRHADSNPHTRGVAEMVYQTVYKGLFSNRMEDRDFALKTYADHIKQVQRTIPEDQLLTFDVAEGWPTLCAFLGVEIPSDPFPMTNSTEDFLKKKRFLSSRDPTAARLT